MEIQEQSAVRSRSEATGVELTEIRIYQYKQFKWGKVPNDGLVLNLADPLTTLVGPNKSGKTTLLKVIHTFCNAVKYGTGEYSKQRALALFHLNHSTSTDVHVLQGTFRLCYDESTTPSDELTLNVIIVKTQLHDVQVYVSSGDVRRILANLNASSFAEYVEPDGYRVPVDFFPELKMFNGQKVFGNSTVL